MKHKSIYLAGAITGLSEEEANGWRNEVRHLINYRDYDNLRWKVINPCEHIPEEINGDIEREQMFWDIWKLKQCDLVVCDFDHPDSIGTSFELAIANELGIPIIGLQTNPDVQLHPWWKMSALHICNDINSLYDYLSEHFLYDN